MRENYVQRSVVVDFALPMSMSDTTNNNAISGVLGASKQDIQQMIENDIRANNNDIIPQILEKLDQLELKIKTWTSAQLATQQHVHEDRIQRRTDHIMDQYESKLTKWTAEQLEQQKTKLYLLNQDVRHHMGDQSIYMFKMNQKILEIENEILELEKAMGGGAA